VIYCKLKGGLGNMMFQISAAMNLAAKKNTETCFPNFSNHLKYANSRWHLQYSKEKSDFRCPNDAEEYRRFLKLNEQPDKNTKSFKIYNYPFQYSDWLPNETDFAIDGYFQSEKYFTEIREDLLQFFKPPAETEAIIEKKYGHLLNGRTISLHVRRGDYVNLSNLYNILNVDYYKNSIDSVGDYENCLVFADDIAWCKENFCFKNCFFVENEKDYIEMFLMSKCDVNIISNSSFSWWGAWLNKKPHKIIAPDKWFEKGYSHLSDKDIIPENWFKIKT